MKPLVIAVDGPAAAGKGTLARRLAARFGLAHLDTGSLYRAVGARVLREGGDPADAAVAADAAKRLTAEELGDPGLRSEAVGRAASVVAAHPGVRANLLAFQKNFAAHPPGGAAGAVLDGRDIGTVICPDADVKLFVTASLEARSERRLAELQAKGEAPIRARVFADMADRDRRDSERSAAPLIAARDAHKLDTSTLDADAAFEAALAVVKAKTGRAGPQAAGGAP